MRPRNSATNDHSGTKFSEARIAAGSRASTGDWNASATAAVIASMSAGRSARITTSSMLQASGSATEGIVAVPPPACERVLREGLADQAPLLELRLGVVLVHQRDEVDRDRLG